MLGETGLDRGWEHGVFFVGGLRNEFEAGGLAVERGGALESSRSGIVS